MSERDISYFLETPAWRGLDLRLYNSENGLNCWVSKTDFSEAESVFAQGLLKLYSLADRQIRQLPIVAFEPLHQINILLLSSSDFKDKSGIPPLFQWAQVCSRPLTLDSDKEGIVVLDVNIVNSLSDDDLQHMMEWKLSLCSEGALDLLREAVHELLPQRKEHITNFPQISCRPIAEAIDELVPSIYLGLINYMPNYRQLRLDLSEDDLLTVEEMFDHHFSKFSAEPVRQNRAYASVLVWGVGIIDKIMEIKSISSLGALNILVNCLVSASEPGDAINILATELDIDSEEMWHGRTFQIRGQAVLEKLANLTTGTGVRPEGVFPTIETQHK